MEKNTLNNEAKAFASQSTDMLLEKSPTGISLCVYDQRCLAVGPWPQQAIVGGKQQEQLQMEFVF